ncbi:hypothetical protein OC834_005301 [Tilletia horrida]|nr:hypothetical protein OC834_005301 [Tilletia horrida]
MAAPAQLPSPANRLSENYASPRPSTNMENEQDYFLSKSEQRPFGSSDARHSQSLHASNIALDKAAGPMAGSLPASASSRGYAGLTTTVDEKRYQPQSGPKSFFKRKPWLLALIALVIVAAIAGGIGGGISASHSSNSKAADGKDGSSSSAGKNGNGDANGNNNNSTSSSPPVIPLQRWDWTNKNQKAYGVNVGNWLLLERWLSEDWFVQGCNYCGDEFHWTQAMGANATAALQDHYKTWFVESDLDFLQSYGVNTVRIPVGFWALIPTVSGEPYVNAGQMDYLGQLLTWLHKRGMYAVISLHGLPGSQSGDQSTGLKKNWGEVPGGQSWFTPTNQNRSDAALLALADWVAHQGNYSTVVSAILPVNEPKQTEMDNSVNQDWQAQLVDYYERSYAVLVQHGIVMAVHPGYYQGQQPAGWQGFMNTKDPNMVIWETHPYPGYFPTVYDDSQIMNTVCNLASIQNDISVPIFFGEWSLLSGVTSPGWVQTYFKAQIQAYNQGAGGTLWNWKANNSTLAGNGGLALPGAQMGLYDFHNLVNMGVIPKPAQPSDALSTLESNYVNSCNYNSKRGFAGGEEEKMGMRVRRQEERRSSTSASSSS